VRYEIPDFKLMPKKRPQGKTYRMPKEYIEWKDALRQEMARRFGPVPTLWPRLQFHVEMYAPKRPRKGDRDNLVGGLMDALQPPSASGDVRAQRSLAQLVSIEERLEMSPGCLYGDDGQIDDLRIRWVKSRRPRVVIHCNELPPDEDEPWVD
jgi:Holliday junction resolvase RusA-like endonuclease